MKGIHANTCNNKAKKEDEPPSLEYQRPKA
ncbi:uncharacterized protein G2W53_033833 [Senna tora]|uniref:Uncharacterized protein n=1 Tax=Senna tora TaxID=362788 RepID=A0A834W8D7_9FABA|nr:uncharacterized protein G2W53_033833 [Senna tora]